MSTSEMATAPAAAAERSGRLSGLAVVRDYGIVASFAALFITLCLTSDAFFTSTNLLNILDQWSPALIMAAASTIVLIAGGFDLSIGAIFGLAGVVAAVMVDDVGVVWAFVIALGAGLACGLGNGLLTTFGRINPFITTLASMMIITGLAVLVSSGSLITVTDPAFDKLGRNELLGISYKIWVAGVFILICGFVLSRTLFGRFVYAVGGNPEAAWLSGVSVVRVRLITFVLSGASAAIAGMLVASETATGQADAGGLKLALDAITGVILGGISIAGGEGAMWRTVLGVLLLALIGNGFNLLGIDANYQQIAQGVIILTAVAVDSWARFGRS